MANAHLFPLWPLCVMPAIISILHNGKMLRKTIQLKYLLPNVVGFAVGGHRILDTLSTISKLAPNQYVSISHMYEPLWKFRRFRGPPGNFTYVPSLTRS